MFKRLYAWYLSRKIRKFAKLLAELSSANAQAFAIKNHTCDGDIFLDALDARLRDNIKAYKRAERYLINRRSLVLERQEDNVIELQYRNARK